MFDVLGIGCNSIDFLCLLDGPPVEDEKIEVSRIEMQGGGNIGTALVAVSKLGGKAGYYWAVGDDEYRERILSEFAKYGVDTGFVEITGGKNPIAVILVNRQTSTRTIFYTKRDIAVLSPEQLEESIVTKGRVLLIDFYHPETSLAVSRLAAKNGIPVVLDAEKVVECADEVMKNSNYVIASRGFASEFCGTRSDVENGKLLEIFAKNTSCAVVCITFGKNGAQAYVREDKEVIRQNAFPIDVLDTTGAGDVFHGAFSFCIAKGYSIRESLKVSAACAALKCRALGGRRGVPGMEEVKALIRTAGSD